MTSQFTRLARIPNPKYERSGLKSYVYLINKYKFQTTKPGPYQMVKRVAKPKGLYRLLKLIGIKSHQNGQQQHILEKTASSGGTTQVDAADQQNDSEYLVNVSIGTPAKTFALDFDTGSSDLWVFSSELPKSTNTSGHNIYDPKKSSSSKKVSKATWKISYGDGSSASGDVYSDTLTIGDVTVTGQEIEAAKVLSSEFASGAGDGLLGLAWPAINTVTPKQAATPVENMISQGVISAGIFTAHLASWRDADAANGEGESFYTFGGLDDAVLQAYGVSEPYYTPVDNSQGFWQFSGATASVNGTSIDRSGNTSIADTGTTLALVDDKTCEAIYAAIPGSKYDDQQQGYVFPTSVTPAQLPVVKFAVGDQEFAVPKSSLAFAETGDGNCYGGIQSRGTMTFDILGDTWLKGIYAVFDQSGQRFGAIQRPDPTGSSLASPPSDAQS